MMNGELRARAAVLMRIFCGVSPQRSSWGWKADGIGPSRHQPRLSSAFRLRSAVIPVIAVITFTAGLIGGVWGYGETNIG